MSLETQYLCLQGIRSKFTFCPNSELQDEMRQFRAATDGAQRSEA